MQLHQHYVFDIDASPVVDGWGRSKYRNGGWVLSAIRIIGRVENAIRLSERKLDGAIWFLAQIVPLFPQDHVYRV